MIFEHRIYQLHPGMTDQYLQYYEVEGLPIQTEHLGSPVAFFGTEIGPMNRIIHIWRYADYEDRVRRRNALQMDLRWPDVLERLRQMTVSQESSLLRAAPFSAIH